MNVPLTSDGNPPAAAAPARPALPLLVFVVTVVLGASIASDLNGDSYMDTLAIQLGSFAVLKVYLWIEGAAFASAVAWIGLHVVRAGFAVTRGMPANVFGIPMRVRPGVLPSAGYIFVLLGAALVALAITSVALLNSCRYMRII
ncbi:MAG TPA: hypothetical protein VM166_05775 [Gemmatimonadaceae bacterium]|nr:hypothetical protein [Gemmatimonadaceae bacterium]